MAGAGWKVGGQGGLNIGGWRSGGLYDLATVSP